MISFAESERIQGELDQLAASNKGYVIQANSSRVLEICRFDVVEADRQLRRLQERHPLDCDIVGENPLELKIYGTFVATASERSQKDQFVKRRKWKSQRLSDNRQWESMRFEPDNRRSRHTRSPQGRPSGRNFR